MYSDAVGGEVWCREIMLSPRQGINQFLILGSHGINVMELQFEYYVICCSSF